MTIGLTKRFSAAIGMSLQAAKKIGYDIHFFDQVDIEDLAPEYPRQIEIRALIGVENLEIHCEITEITAIPRMISVFVKEKKSDHIFLFKDGKIE